MSVRSEQGDFSPPTLPASAVFVAADEPLLVFPSARDAESHLEAIDVANGVYPIGYGPGGECYSISTDGSRVFVERTADESDPEALKMLLIKYLDAQRQRVRATAPLSELAAAVWKVKRWELHGPRYSAWNCLLVVLAIAGLLLIVFKLT